MGTLPATILVLLGGDLRLAPSAACLRSSGRLGALVRESLHPTGLLMATAIVAGLVWVPWTQLVPWRPRGVTPGTIELVLVGAKLGVVVVLSALGWSLVARTAAFSRTRM